MNWQILNLHLEIFAASALLLGGLVVARNVIVKFAIPAVQQKLKERALIKPRSPLSPPIMPGHTQRIARFGKLAEKAA